MPKEKRDVEPTERIHFLLPKELTEYVDKRVKENGYGATRSSVIRELISKDKREREGK